MLQVHIVEKQSLPDLGQLSREQLSALPGSVPFDSLAGALPQDLVLSAQVSNSPELSCSVVSQLAGRVLAHLSCLIDVYLCTVTTPGNVPGQEGCGSGCTVAATAAGFEHLWLRRRHSATNRSDAPALLRSRVVRHLFMQPTC